MKRRTIPSVSLPIILLIVVTLLASCTGVPPAGSPPATSPSGGQPSSTEEPLAPGALSPGQIDESLLDQGVKVQGKVLTLIENPGGNGGAYIKLGNGNGEVGLRIEPADWDALSGAEKAKYKQGSTVTAEGILVRSGQELVVVLGVIPPSAGAGQASGADYTFTVTVPENTILADAVCLELFDEKSSRLGQLEMEQVNATTWRCTVPAGIRTLGYRYCRDHWGFIAAEEFTPDSQKTLRWARDLTPGQEINDTITKWRYCPEPGFQMPVVVSQAATAAIAPRLNGEAMQCGYGFVDYFWSFFPELYHGTDMAMIEANGNWMKIMPPVDYSQIDPLPVMDWEPGGSAGNPVYGEGELEQHILQAQKDGLNVFLVPQCGNSALDWDNAPYSDAWWEAYYDEMEKYGTYFARLAEKCGVKYMAMQDDNIWNSPRAPSDMPERYAEYIDNIRKYYTGKLGMTWGLASYETPNDVFPTGYHPEKFDFLAVGGPGAIAGSKNSSAEEMQANFQKMVDGALDTLYETYHKPIILYAYGVPSCDGGASGDFLGDDDLMQPWSEYNDKYSLDLAEQAQAFEAVMRVVADTPYIIGFYTMNSHWPSPFPVSKNVDMWGKPAIDQVLSRWYQRFRSAGR
jgi:hypothetical protein